LFASIVSVAALLCLFYLMHQQPTIIVFEFTLGVVIFVASASGFYIGVSCLLKKVYKANIILGTIVSGWIIGNLVYALLQRIFWSFF
jgi:hypothetical protein